MITNSIMGAVEGLTIVPDFDIPPGVASVVHGALRAFSKLDNEQQQYIDHEHLDTADILTEDGAIDSREVDRQLKFFADDEEFINFYQSAPKGSVSNIIWLLHGGHKAKKWLNKLRKDGT